MAAFGKLGGTHRAEIFTEGTEHYVNNADKHENGLFEHAQVKARAADHEKERVKGLCPAFGSFHHFFRGLAHVAEDRAEHHAGEQRREPDNNLARGEGKMCHDHREEHEGDDEGKAVGTRMEQLFHLRKNIAGDRAENEGENDLDQRVHHNGNNINGAAVDRLGNAEGNRKNDQSHGVIQRNDGQKQVGKRAACLILTNHHKRSRGSRCRRDGSENEAGGQGKNIFALGFEQQEVGGDQRDIHKYRGSHSLDNAYHRCLLACFF